MSKRILFVDDEKSILKALRREFIDSEYELYFASSGREALDLMEEMKFDLVSSDVKMPEMDGLKFLTIVKERHPEVIRLALSAYVEENLILKYLSNNIAKVILAKPWKEHEIEGAIDQIFESYEKLNSRELIDFIQNGNQLPAMPSIYKKISNMLKDEDTDAERISEEISTDMAMASKILKVANAAFYGIKTGSLKSAIVNLGLRNIKNIISTIELLDMGSDNKYRDILWNHSNLTNLYMAQLYKSLTGSRIPDQYSAVGLLHDTGKAVMIKIHIKEYGKVFRMLEENPDIDSIESEKSIFGVDHQEIGAYVLNWWDMPEPVVHAALYHHEPEKANPAYREMVYITHIADYFSWKNVYDRMTPHLYEKAFSYFNTSYEKCENMISSMELRV